MAVSLAGSAIVAAVAVTEESIGSDMACPGFRLRVKVAVLGIRLLSSVASRMQKIIFFRIFFL